jgi:hypothetical protein
MSFELTHARGGKSARSWRSGRDVMMKFRSNKKDTIACPDVESSNGSVELNELTQTAINSEWCEVT